MTKKSYTKRIIPAFSLLLLLSVGCGDGFNAKSVEKASNGGLGTPDGNNGGNNNDNTNNGNVGNLTPPEVNGKVEGGIWDGNEVLEIDWFNKELVVKLPMDFQAEVVEGRIELPNQPDVKIEIVTNSDGNQQIQVRVSLSKLFGETDPFTMSGLPNGDPLPRVPGGELPRYDTEISRQDVHFYLGKGTLATFIPTKFNPHIYIVWPIKNKDQQILGYFATIPAKGELHRGGFYASLQLPDSLKDVIEDYTGTGGQ